MKTKTLAAMLGVGVAVIGGSMLFDLHLKETRAAIEAQLRPTQPVDAAADPGSVVGEDASAERVEVIRLRGAFAASAEAPGTDDVLPRVEVMRTSEDAFEIGPGGSRVRLEWSWTGTAPQGLGLVVTDPQGQAIEFPGGIAQPQRVDLAKPAEGSWSAVANANGAGVDVEYTILVIVAYGPEGASG